MLTLADRAVGAVAKTALAAAMVLLAVSLAAVCYGVFMRDVLNETLRRGELLAVDVLSERFGPRSRQAVEVAGMAVVMAVGGVLISSGADMVQFSARINRLSEGYLAVPLAWTQFAIPLGGGLLALAAASRLLGVLTGRVVLGHGGHGARNQGTDRP